MPFQSEKQLRTCFGREIIAKSKHQKWTWDCEEWANKTNLDSLKSIKRDAEKRVGEKRGKRRGKKISPIYEGSRGGHYFFVGDIKIYVPKGDGALAYATQRYGKAF